MAVRTKEEVDAFLALLRSIRASAERNPEKVEAVLAAIRSNRTWEDETDLGTPYINMRRLAEIAVHALEEANE